MNGVYRKSTHEEMVRHTLFDHLPPGTWAAAVRAQLPFTTTMKEACDLAYARLISQISGPIPEVRSSPVEEDETEIMPAVIHLRRLTWGTLQ
jgi:hypothetical protein